jgi:hypothetical protein
LHPGWSGRGLVINCGGGTNDEVTKDAGDTVIDCEKIF